MNSLKDLFERTAVAAEHAVLPAGEYTAGHAAYKLTFRVTGGPHVDQLFWHDLYLTEAAMPHTKRDLMKLGFTAFDQLDRPLPRFRCLVKLSVRTSNAGPHNRVSAFTVLGVDEPEPDTFAPKSVAPTRRDSGLHNATPPAGKKPAGSTPASPGKGRKRKGERA
jgi:hypothetical protein